MRNYEEEFKRFQIDPINLPNYENAEKFAQKFQRCTIYKNVNTTYSDITKCKDTDQIVNNA